MSSPQSTLSALQDRLLVTLTRVRPRWVLTGGAALAGFHLGHRITHDLDLFWPGRDQLDELPEAVSRAIEAEGLSVARVTTSPRFVRLQVSDGKNDTVVDLVADVSDRLEPPVELTIGGQSILVDTPYEILVNKLTTLLNRLEVRDVRDVRALMGAGVALDRALGDAPRKDGGFSPLTLAWVLQTSPLSSLFRVDGGGDAAELDLFLAEFINHLIKSSAPQPPT